MFDFPEEKKIQNIHAHVQVVHCENTQNRFFFCLQKNSDRAATVVLASLDGIKPEVERAHQDM